MSAELKPHSAQRPKAAIQSSYPYSHYCTPTHTHSVNKAVTSDRNDSTSARHTAGTGRAARPSARVVWQWPACTAVQTNVRYDLPLCVHAALPRMTITITPTHPQESPRLSRNRHATRGTTRSYPTAGDGPHKLPVSSHHTTHLYFACTLYIPDGSLPLPATPRSKLSKPRRPWTTTAHAHTSSAKEALRGWPPVSALLSHHLDKLTVADPSVAVLVRLIDQLVDQRRIGRTEALRAQPAHDLGELMPLDITLQQRATRATERSV